MKKLVIAILAVSLSFGVCGAKNKYVKKPAEWQKIQISDNLNYDKAWNMVLESITNDFEMDMISKDGGYARSSWTTAKAKNGKKDKKHLVRITIKFNHDRTQLQVKTEAQKVKNAKWEGEDIEFTKKIREDLRGIVGL